MVPFTFTVIEFLKQNSLFVIVISFVLMCSGLFYVFWGKRAEKCLFAHNGQPDLNTISNTSMNNCGIVNRNEYKRNVKIFFRHEKIRGDIVSEIENNFDCCTISRTDKIELKSILKSRTAQLG